MKTENATQSLAWVVALALEATVSPKTIVKVLQGKTVRGNAGDRARAACRKAGLLKEEEIA